MLARVDPVLLNALNPQDNFGGTVYTFNAPITTEAVAGAWSATWATLLSSVPYDIGGFEISSSTSATSATNSAALIELRYTIGGTSTTIVETMPMGGSTGQRPMYFPIFIPAGATVEWRVKSLQTSFVYRIVTQFFPMGGPLGAWTRPFTGCKCTGIDAVTTLAGPSVSGGNSAWTGGGPVSIGTFAEDAWAVRLLPHLTTASIATPSGCWARLSVGGALHYITRFSTNANPSILSPFGIMPHPTFIASGSTAGCEVFNGTASGTAINYTAQYFYGPI